MIRSFRDRETELIWNGVRSRKLPGDIQDKALVKLSLLNRAVTLDDLRVPRETGSKDSRGNAVTSTRYASTTSGGFASNGGKDMRIASKLLTIIETAGPDDLLHNPHAGEILLSEFLQPMGLSQNALARAISVPPRRINEIVLGKRSVTADTDLRLARYFGISEGFFLGLQADHELRERKRALAAELNKIVPRAA